MNKTFLRRGLAAVSVLVTGGSFLASSPASATPLPPSEVAVGIGGSDTTDVMMGQIAGAFTGSTVTISTGTKTARVYNVPALPGPSGFVVPGDADCSADVTWTKDPLAPATSGPSEKGKAPFGSSSGRNYLRLQETDSIPNDNARPDDRGCLDVSRSSAAPRAINATNDSANFEYYAYAMDAQSWVTTSHKAPASLSQAELVSIFDCVVTNWAGVGGVSGPIQRYMPQTGSGTRQSFIANVLGKPSTYSPPTGIAGCPDAINIEENQFKLGPTGAAINRDHIDKAIVGYSASVWSFQEANRVNPTIDKRNGARLGAIEAVVTASPIRWVGSNNAYELDTSGVVNESNILINDPTPDFPGIRYVYNVLDTTPNTQGYEAAFALFGFDNTVGGFKSPLCNNDSPSDATAQFANAAILSNGFAPLPSNVNLGNSNVAGSTCRFDTPP